MSHSGLPSSAVPPSSLRPPGPSPFQGLLNTENAAALVVRWNEGPDGQLYSWTPSGERISPGNNTRPVDRRLHATGQASGERRPVDATDATADASIDPVSGRRRHTLSLTLPTAVLTLPPQPFNAALAELLLNSLERMPDRPHDLTVLINEEANVHFLEVLGRRHGPPVITSNIDGHTTLSASLNSHVLTKLRALLKACVLQHQEEDERYLTAYERMQTLLNERQQPHDAALTFTVSFDRHGSELRRRPGHKLQISAQPGRTHVPRRPPTPPPSVRQEGTSVYEPQSASAPGGKVRLLWTRPDHQATSASIHPELSLVLTELLGWNSGLNTRVTFVEEFQGSHAVLRSRTLVFSVPETGGGMDITVHDLQADTSGETWDHLHLQDDRIDLLHRALFTLNRHTLSRPTEQA